MRFLPRRIRIIVAGAFVFLGAALLVLFSARPAALFPDGSLVRANGDARVYVIQEGVKRWIDSAETFRLQGFSWDLVSEVAPDALDAYRDGEPIIVKSPVVLTGEIELLPDLVPFAAEELEFGQKDGRILLRFSAVFWNQGGGALNLLADPAAVKISANALRDIFQRIKNAAGGERLRLAGNFLWHAAHGHYHVGDVMDYTLYQADAYGVPAAKSKVTFCLRDDRAVALDKSGAPPQRTYTVCDENQQGVSVGWADVYRYTLPDQFFDVHDFSPGTYHLWFELNPKKHIAEQRFDNNVSVVIFRMDPAASFLEVVAAAAPFPGGSSFPNEALVRGDKDSVLYVLHNNKKRPVLSGAVLSYYGGAATAYLLPQSIVDAMPAHNLVRGVDATVYALNDYGYKRAIHSREVFEAYGFLWDDVAAVSAGELESFPDASFIQRAGDSKVYVIGGDAKRLLSASDRFIPEALHIVNDTDFFSYVFR